MPETKMPWLKGFFNFLKKEDASKVKTAVRLDELENWLEKNSSEKNEKIKFLISEITAEFDEIIRHAREDSAKLRQDEIRKVSDARLVALVEKQREIYAGLFEDFINGLSAAKDKETAEFVRHYFERTARFSKQSFKPFHITSQLVGKPLEKIIDDLRKIDACMKKFSDALSNEITEINALKMLCRELIEKSQDKKINDGEISGFLENIDAINEEIMRLKEADENIGKSADYIEKQRLRQEIAHISSEIRLKKDSIAVFFSKINRALRKFEWMEKNKHKKELLARLAEDAVETAIEKRAEVGELLDEFASKISKKEIDGSLPDVDRAKYSLKTFDEIEKLQMNLKDLQEKENSILIKSNKSRIQELEEEIKKIAKLRQNCENEAKEIEISIRGIKAKIAGKALQALGKEIEISG